MNEMCLLSSSCLYIYQLVKHNAAQYIAPKYESMYYSSIITILNLFKQAIANKVFEILCCKKF